MTIETDPPPTAGTDYPAVTVCRKVPYNPDEYVRAVFDNFKMEEETGSDNQQGKTLWTDFPKHLIKREVQTTEGHPSKL